MPRALTRDGDVDTALSGGNQPDPSPPQLAALSLSPRGETSLTFPGPAYRTSSIFSVIPPGSQRTELLVQLKTIPY